MKDIKILIETVPNPNKKIFNVNKKVSNISIAHFTSSEDIDTGYYANRVGKLGIILMKRLFNIEGIDEIFLQKYSIDIMKAKLFDWEELEKKITQTIKFSIEEFTISETDIDDIVEAASKIINKKFN